MKKTYKASLFVGIIASVLISTSAFATNGMRLIGFGHIQDSMGGQASGFHSMPPPYSPIPRA